jgi:flap endonuclease-1
MGVKNFSKIFTPKEIKLKSLNGFTAIIDASVMLYQSCLGMSNINSLTDGDGNSTIHLKVIISRVLNFHVNNIKQKWVFDYHEANYSPPDKALELKKRKFKKDTAKKKIKKINDSISLAEKEYKELFSDSDDGDDTHEKKTENHSKKIIAVATQEKNKQEKIAFTMSERIVNDCKFILNCFNIPWLVAPKGIEAEHVCAQMTNDDIGDFVYSTDVDALLYGAKKLVRRVTIKKKQTLQLYDLYDILKHDKLTQDDLLKIGVIMGCDHCTKTRGIGPKTILKKYKTVELTDEQKNAISIFKRTIDTTGLKFENSNKIPIDDAKKINKLMDWLEDKNFKRVLIKKQIEKVYKGDDLK